MVLLLGLFVYCQAQPQLQLNWAELALFSLSTLNLLNLRRNLLILSGKVFFSAVRARIFTKFELVTVEARHFTTFNYSHHQTKPGWVRGQKLSYTMVLSLGLFDYCQAQPQLQLTWAEVSMPPLTQPTNPFTWSLFFIESDIFGLLPYYWFLQDGLPNVCNFQKYENLSSDYLCFSNLMC